MSNTSKPLSDCMDTYTRAVARGDIAQAYRGILSALSSFKSAWGESHTFDKVGELYQGYMDMSFVSVLPASLAQKRLKIALVYLHPTGDFSLWLTAGNRAIQKSVSETLRSAPLGHYELSVLEPGVDAIIALDLPKPYAFDEPERLTAYFLHAAEAFLTDMTAIVSGIE